jgi:hypothetical protein
MDTLGETQNQKADFRCGARRYRLTAKAENFRLYISLPNHKTGKQMGIVARHY